MTIPGQPAQSSVSGQPSVSLQLVDGSGRPLTGEVQLGACGGSLAPLSADFTLPATARATVASCQNGPGAAVALNGGLTLESAGTARLTLRGDSTRGPHRRGSRPSWAGVRSPPDPLSQTSRGGRRLPRPPGPPTGLRYGRGGRR